MLQNITQKFPPSDVDPSQEIHFCANVVHKPKFTVDSAGETTTKYTSGQNQAHILLFLSSLTWRISAGCLP